MGQLVLSQETPQAPVSGKTVIYADPADSGRVKAIQSDGSIQQLSASGFRDRNFLMNPEFAIAQRQVPNTLTTYSSTTARVYAADRWAMVNSVASLQFQNVDNNGAPVAGVQARFMGNFKQITGAGKFVLMQWLDGTDSTELAGRTVRFQFKARQTVNPATLRLGMLYLNASGTVDTPPATIASAFGLTGVDPTWGTNLNVINPVTCESSGIINNTRGSSGVDCVLTAAFQRFSATFVIPAGANIKNLVPVIWTSTIPAINDIIQITECGLYVGADIRDYYPRSFGDELIACQRFYEKSFPLLIAPAASVTVANGGYGAQAILNRTGSGTAAAVQVPIQFVARKRAVPTLTLFTPVGAGATAYRHTGTTPAVQGAAAANTSATTEYGSSITVTAEATTNGAVGDLCSIHWTADADI